MAEREALGRLLDDELGGDELLHEREQLALVGFGERLEEREVEPAAGDGGGGGERARGTAAA
jgi:hypothetical protein